MLPLEIAKLTDELGQIKAQQAELKSRTTEIKTLLIDADCESGEGHLYRFTLSDASRTLIDWRAIASKLSPSRQLVTAHSRESTSITLRVSARTGESK